MKRARLVTKNGRPAPSIVVRAARITAGIAMPRAWRSDSNDLPLKSGQSSGCGRKMWIGGRGCAPAGSCSPLRMTSHLATSKPA